jgi:dihydroxyacid dehydratase/phosphogluconate dehydratase
MRTQYHDALLPGHGMGRKVSLNTKGRFPGATRNFRVGQSGLEAARDGPTPPRARRERHDDMDL